MMHRFSDDKLMQMAENITAMLVKMDQVHGAIYEKGGIKDELRRINGRIGSLERSRTWILGAWTATVGIAGTLWALAKAK